MSISIPDTTISLELPAIGSPLELRKTPTITNAAPGSAIVQVLASTISPVHELYLNGTLRYLTFPTPFVPGYSAVCRILIPGVDAVLLQPGQLVLVDSFIRARDDPVGTQILFGLHDGPTPGCKKLFANTWRNGLWTNVAAVPLENCHIIDEEAVTKLGITPEDLVYLPRAAVAYGGISAVQLKPGETIIVAPSSGHYSGAIVELASSIGAKVIALGRSEAKLAKLKATFANVYTVVITGDTETEIASIKAHLSPTSLGADCYIDITPGMANNPTHLNSAVACLRPHARMAIMGGIPGNLSVSYPGIMFRNISIKGQYMYTREEISTVVRMAETGSLKLGKAAGHKVLGTFKLEEWKAALKLAGESVEWGTQVLFTP
jgi:threonine dehydrogenase-like Zn-dependent dehydrogenase